MTAARAAVVDGVILTALCVAALAVRLPQLHAIPRYTDETGEVRTAIAIALEGARPLVHNDAYRGPAWAYLLGGAIAIAGPDPGLPRGFALALGVLTVGATFLLARAMAGRTAGVIAGGLMCTAFAHVVLNSHVAWSNHATPLWTTLAAWALWRGAIPAAGTTATGAATVLPAGSTVSPAGSTRRPLLRPGDRWLAGSGILWGVALQSHPSVLALLPGAVVWFLAAPDRRARLRTPGPWIAAALFALALAPQVVFYVGNARAAWDEATAPSQPVERDLGPAAWLANTVALAGQLGRAAGAGARVEPGDPTPNAVVAATDALRPAATAAYALVLLGALAWSARRGPRLPAALAASMIVMLPLINRSYLNLYDMRYLVPILPLGYVAIGAIVARGPDPTAPRARSRRWRTAMRAAIIGLAAYPLATIAAYYARELDAGRTNHVLAAAADRIAVGDPADPSAGRYVLVDTALRDIDHGGGGDPARAFDQLLTLHQADHDLAGVDEIRHFVVYPPDAELWIVAADATAEQLAAEQPGRLVPVPGLADLPGDGWVVLRLSPNP